MLSASAVAHALSRVCGQGDCFVCVACVITIGGYNVILLLLLVCVCVHVCVCMCACVRACVYVCSIMYVFACMHMCVDVLPLYLPPNGTTFILSNKNLSFAPYHFVLCNVCQ